VRILAFWYARQSFYVKWGNSVSASFNIGNGVTQGSILSPLLFNVYMDDLSKLLNSCGTGCRVGDTIINHLMYADDLVIFCPYSAGLQQLLRVCFQYGLDFDITYNSKKSNIMIVRSREDNKLSFPAFYLGHYITEDLSNNRDIHRQYCMMYAQDNMLNRKFSMCSLFVKIRLFKAFCTPMYTVWRRYKKK